MKRGIFISIEGPGGSGKSTQIENIKKFFAEKNIEVIFTREPGGTAIGERIREILLDKNCTEMDYMTEAMLYAASRAQHVAQVIKPALAEGKVIVCDRFVDSSMAYQGYGRQLGFDEVLEINLFAIDRTYPDLTVYLDVDEYAVAGCMPDVTFLMKVDPSVGKGRVQSRATSGQAEDRLDAEKVAFHEDVYQGYLALERDYPDRIVGIDASRSIEDIKEDILKKLEDLLKGAAESCH